MLRDDQSVTVCLGAPLLQCANVVVTARVGLASHRLSFHCPPRVEHSPFTGRIFKTYEAMGFPISRASVALLVFTLLFCLFLVLRAKKVDVNSLLIELAAAPSRDSITTEKGIIEMEQQPTTTTTAVPPPAATSKYSAQRPAGREHIPLYPKAFITVRILQLIVAIACLGLSGWAIAYLVFAGDALTLFTVSYPSPP